MRTIRGDSFVGTERGEGERAVGSVAIQTRRSGLDADRVEAEVERRAEEDGGRGAAKRDEARQDDEGGEERNAMARWRGKARGESEIARKSKGRVRREGGRLNRCK